MGVLSKRAMVKKTWIFFTNNGEILWDLSRQ
jgi:hypothetical protein